MHRAPTMVKFKNLWLFERSEFRMFLNFIIAQYMAGIRTKPTFILDKQLEMLYFLLKLMWCPLNLGLVAKFILLRSILNPLSLLKKPAGIQLAIFCKNLIDKLLNQTSPFFS